MNQSYYHPVGRPNVTLFRLPSAPPSPPPSMIPTIINHVALVIDSSTSISDRGLTDTVAKLLDNQIAYLAQRDRELNQETRVTVYTFADEVKCLLFDRDVLRLPSLKEHYKPYGNTALIDAVLKAIDDLKDTSERHGDHAYLIIAVTDGENNRNNHLAQVLSQGITGLAANWTCAAMVPNQQGVFACKAAGFPAANISVWDTTVRGGEEAGSVMRAATDSFMRGRASGVRGTKSFFNVDTSKLTTRAVQSNLVELRSSDYNLLNVSKKAAIKPFIESWKLEFRLGGAYYQLTKPEKVQGHKQICIQRKLDGKVYGGSNARKLLGLPEHEVKIEPASHPDYDLFVQSTSTNRNLVPGTKLLVMK